METLTVDQVLVFTTILEEGSFSAAARRLGRVQSAVSYAVAQMEDSLGLELFDRSRRRPLPTAAAKALLPDAWALLERLATLRERASKLSGGEEPEVSVALDSLLPGDAILATLRCFQNSFPATRLVMREETLGAIPELVSTGECQFGFSAGFFSGHAIASEPCGSVELLLVASSEHPLARVDGVIENDELTGHTQIVVSDRSAKTDGVDHGVFASTTWRVPDFRAKLAFIRAGFGFGSVPRHLCQHAIEEGELALIRISARPSAATEVPVSSLSRRSTSLGPAATWLRTELSRSIGGNERANDSQ